MAKGINQKVFTEILNLESTSLVDLYALYYDYQNDSQAVLYFHGGSNGLAKPIIFDGQEYIPIPVEAEGFEVLGDQGLPRPKLRVSNAGLYISSMLRKYNNLNGAKLIRRRTFVKFLDDANFPNDKNPWGEADPNAKLGDEKFFVSRKIIENKMMAEFELVSSLELENINIPSRDISARYCNWVYRGYGCRYGSKSASLTDGSDRPVADIRDSSFVIANGSNWQLNPDLFPIIKTAANINGVLVHKGRWQENSIYAVGDYIYTVSDRIANSQGFTANYYQNHPVYYVCKSPHTASSDAFKPNIRSDLWVKDCCSKKISACKMRFDNQDFDDGINTNQTLPFGGFPGTDNFSY